MTQISEGNFYHFECEFCQKLSDGPLLNFQGIIFIFLILVLVRFHSVTILVPNQDEPKTFVLEPKLTET